MLSQGLYCFIFLISLHSALAQSGLQFRLISDLQKNENPIGLSSPDLVAIKSNGHVFLLSPTGEKTILPYDSISFNRGAFWDTWKDGLKGVYHVEKGELLPPVFESSAPISKSETNWAYIVFKYNMNAVVTTQNKLILPYRKERYSRVVYVGDTILSYDINGHPAFVSCSGIEIPESVGKNLMPPQFIYTLGVYVFTSYQNNIAHSDTFKVAQTFINNIALVKKDSLWGYFRRNGSWLLTPRFQSGRPFDLNGRAIVQLNGKYGLIKTNGSFFIEPHFDSLKSFIPGIFEFKLKGESGLVDTTGKIMLPPGAYSGFQTAGTNCFAAKSGDSLLIFRRNGKLIPLGRVVECSKNVYDDCFLVRQVPSSASKYDRVGQKGVLTSEGKWRIPNILKEQVWERKLFFIALAVVDPCCVIGKFNLESNDSRKRIVFYRNGDPVFPYLLDEVYYGLEDDFIMYRLNARYGAFLSPEVQMTPEFNRLRSLGNGWILARKDEKSTIWKLAVDGRR